MIEPRDNLPPASALAPAHAPHLGLPYPIVLNPIGLHPRGQGVGVPLGGGPLGVGAVEAFIAGVDGQVFQCRVSLDTLQGWAAGDGRALAGALQAALDLLTAPRPPFAGIDHDRPRIAGIVNVTPDSFSDGGLFAAPKDAIAHGMRLIEAGADLLDIGGESTRPGAAPVPADEQVRRIVPVISALAREGVVVSADTSDAEVMRATIDEGARVINDTAALTADPAALSLVASSGASVMLMHRLAAPVTMQARPHYRHAPLEIYAYLAARVAAAEAAGIARADILIDPGIGFGKTVAHNLALLAAAPMFQGLGCAVMIGASRKSFIGEITGIATPARRMVGSAATAAIMAAKGVQWHRVHDVAETRAALDVARAIAEGGRFP